MQENPDQEASPSRGEPADLRASNGEVVRRADLDRAAGTSGKFTQEDPDVAGYEGITLARAALAGDQAALDEFHERAGVALPGVTEHGEGHVVRLVMLEIDEEVGGLEVQGTSVRQRGEVRPTFDAANQDGHDCTHVDAAELVAWILSPAGRAALARRGIAVPPSVSLTPEEHGELRRTRAIVDHLYHRELHSERPEWGDPLGGCSEVLAKLVEETDPGRRQAGAASQVPSPSVAELCQAIDDCPQVMASGVSMSRIDPDWWAWLRRVQIINDRVRRAARANAKQVQTSDNPSPGTTWTTDQLVVAARNVGVDLTCGECAALFFTGLPSSLSGPPAHALLCKTKRLPHRVLAVSCTCGTWQVEASATPPVCPRCGAPERHPVQATDYLARPWEELDVRRRMYGVFHAEGHTPDPVAVFRTEDAAARWLTWQKTLGDDAEVGSTEDYTIMPVDQIDGVAWNSYEPPPTR